MAALADAGISHERRDRQAARRRRAAVRRGLREAAEGGGDAEPRSGSGTDQPPDLHAARAAGRRGEELAGRVAAPRARSGGSGGATPRSGAARTKRSGSAGSASPTTSWRTSQRFAAFADVARSAGFSHMPAAGHGRIEPRSGGDEDDVRQDRGLPGAARARFDRPGAGDGVREQASISTNTLVHRVEQVGLDARAEHLQAVFLRPRRRSWWAAQEAGRRFVAITDPGSKMQQVAERDGFRHVFFGWPNIGGRYSVLSDFGLVPGGHHGRGRGQVPGPDRGDGVRLHAVGAGRTKTPGSCSAPSSASPRSSSAATR